MCQNEKIKPSKITFLYATSVQLYQANMHFTKYKLRVRITNFVKQP